MTIIHIYTDGACSNNPGPGGWAAIVLDADKPRRLSGAVPSTTNNRMEMTAAIKGLDAVAIGSKVKVHSDSQYLVNTMTKNWKRRANNDLWLELDNLVAAREVTWNWVRGHSGNPYNEEADLLATAAVSSIRRPLEISGEALDVELSHIDENGRARMVDVGEKPDTSRRAVATGRITMLPATLALIMSGNLEKGDVFTVARIAAITAAKRTWEIIPLAHQIPLSYVSVDFEIDHNLASVTINAGANSVGKTGVEMEALTAVMAAGLTIYDMCKAVDRGMRMDEIHLLEKTGGRSGSYTFDA